MLKTEQKPEGASVFPVLEDMAPRFPEATRVAWPVQADPTRFEEDEQAWIIDETWTAVASQVAALHLPGEG